MPLATILTPEMIDLLKKVVRLTRDGSLAWEVTADPDVLVAPLGGDYSVKIQRVPDFGDDEESSDIPDQVVTIAKGRRELFTLDRRDFNNLTTFRAAFADTLVRPTDGPYPIFKELWDRAYFKAAKIEDEVSAINKLLDTKLRSGGA